MKRIVIVTTLVVVALVGSYAVRAQQDRYRPGMQARMRYMGEEDGMCPMCRYMMASSMGGIIHKSMVDLEDGGICVMVGNQLFLYNANLELQAQTEVPVDMEQILQKMMEARDLMMQMKESRQMNGYPMNGDRGMDGDRQMNEDQPGNSERSTRQKQDNSKQE